MGKGGYQLKFSDFWKNHKAFILFVIIVVLFFFALIMDNHFKLRKMEKDYENQIEKLKNLVQVTNIGVSPEIEFDIYQTAEDFLCCYYGISEEISADYRLSRLKELMTDAAYTQYVTGDFDNTLGYSVSLSDIHIYVDYRNSNQEKVYACIFYNENTDWSSINTITTKKYWMGVFTYDNSLKKWKLSEITNCQELLTKEEFEAFLIDTDISSLKNEETGGAEVAETGKKE